jgi:uncharacterized repeat protein (TIGR04076 family)
MAKEPGFGFRVMANVTDVKGECNAGHQVGDSFEISIINTGGLCGAFYHNIFPNLQTFQFGGNMPWCQGDSIYLQCPDVRNPIIIKLERSRRK